MVKRPPVMLLCPYALHRLPAFWPDPEKFDPDRFSPENTAARPKWAHLPFGAGQRMCIGAQFAIWEGQLIAAMLLQRFRLRPATQRVEPLPSLTLRQAGGLPVHLERA